MTIQERKHRLPRDQYKGIIRATFTICAKDKAELFTKDEIVNEFIERLKIANNKHVIANWCYVFMPDHVHILNEGKTEASDLLKGMDLFKQYCGYYISKHNRNVSAVTQLGSRNLQVANGVTQAEACGYRSAYRLAGLQKDFYDHIHRKDEDLIRHVRYLLENPVRKGLAARWQDYKFKGSLDYDLEEIIS